MLTRTMKMQPILREYSSHQIHAKLMGMMKCDDYYERMDESEEEDYEATINFAIWMDRQADDSSAAV